MSSIQPSHADPDIQRLVEQVRARLSRRKHASTDLRICVEDLEWTLKQTLQQQYAESHLRDLFSQPEWYVVAQYREHAGVGVSDYHARSRREARKFCAACSITIEQLVHDFGEQNLRSGRFTSALLKFAAVGAEYKDLLRFATVQSQERRTDMSTRRGKKRAWQPVDVERGLEAYLGSRPSPLSATAHGADDESSDNDEDGIQQTLRHESNTCKKRRGSDLCTQEPAPSSVALPSSPFPKRRRTDSACARSPSPAQTECGRASPRERSVEAPRKQAEDAFADPLRRQVSPMSVPDDLPNNSFLREDTLNACLTPHNPPEDSFAPYDMSDGSVAGDDTPSGSHYSEDVPFQDLEQRSMSIDFLLHGQIGREEGRESDAPSLDNSFEEAIRCSAVIDRRVESPFHFRFKGTPPVPKFNMTAPFAARSANSFVTDEEVLRLPVLQGLATSTKPLSRTLPPISNLNLTASSAKAAVAVQLNPHPKSALEGKIGEISHLSPSIPSASSESAEALIPQPGTLVGEGPHSHTLHQSLAVHLPVSVTGEVDSMNPCRLEAPTSPIKVNHVQAMMLSSQEPCAPPTSSSSAPTPASVCTGTMQLVTDLTLSDGGVYGDQDTGKPFDLELHDVHYNRLRDREMLDDGLLRHLLRCFSVAAKSWGVVDSLYIQRMPSVETLTRLYACKETLFFPVHHHSQAHWSCIIINDCSSPVAHHYDSAPSPAHSATARKYVTEFFGIMHPAMPLTFRDAPSARQLNGVDCGIFVLVNAMHLLLAMPPPHPDLDSDLWRRVFAAMLRPGDEPMPERVDIGKQDAQRVIAMRACRDLLAALSKSIDGTEQAWGCELNIISEELDGHITIRTAASKLRSSSSEEFIKTCDNTIPPLKKSLQHLQEKLALRERLVLYLQSASAFIVSAYQSTLTEARRAREELEAAAYKHEEQGREMRARVAELKKQEEEILSLIA